VESVKRIMKRLTFLKQACLIGGGTMIWMPAGMGHEVVPHHHHGHWFMPHVRPLPRPVPGPQAPVEVKKIEARVRIEDQMAKTTLTVALYNPAGRQQEGQVLLPVPHGAVLKSFKLEGQNGSFQAEILPREEARRIYDQIVSSMKDPAILEFAGFGAIKSSVFPVPAAGTARLEMVYEELLPVDAGRIDYVLPRSESLECKADWSIEVDWRVKGGIATTYSPSHGVTPKKEHGGIRVRTSGRINPGPFRLSVLRKKKKEAVASFLTHPDESGKGGWFLLLMAPPEPRDDGPKLKREVTVVLDRSGSMAGEKLDQARAAAHQVIEGLESGDYFNLIIYNEAVERFAEAPLVASRANILRARKFINGIRVSGGTNIHGALEAAVGQSAVKGAVPIVLFLTDGLPTIGVTSEKRIRESIAQSNKRKRRIFTFGVGVDVNTALLSRLADDSRATATYVMPKEKVEVKVAQVFRRLSGPVLSSPVLKVVDGSGNKVPGRIDDLVPHRLPDFFANDQVIVAGRYNGRGALDFKLTGGDGERDRSFKFRFKPGGSRHPFVPRLWAMRKIAVLTEALRDLGADSALTGLTGDGVDRSDPRVKELVDEIVRLSTEHGILTEYTAFLARDGEVFRPQARQNSEAGKNFVRRALKSRSGAGGANQDYNLWAQKGASTVNPTNGFLNAELEQEEVANVQQAADKVYYKRGDEWVDAIVADNSSMPVVEIEVGSEKFKKLVDRLVATERQSCLSLGNNLEVVVDGNRYRIR
jgi:Ca-activated chloride channel family protein